MAYLHRGYSVTKFNMNRLNRGLKMDEIYFKNIKEIKVRFHKHYHKNMRYIDI